MKIAVQKLSPYRGPDIIHRPILFGSDLRVEKSTSENGLLQFMVFGQHEDMTV